jgi:formate-dependent nitrite reductase membrane component NrfD
MRVYVCEYVCAAISSLCSDKHLIMHSSSVLYKKYTRKDILISSICNPPSLPTNVLHILVLFAPLSLARLIICMRTLQTQTNTDTRTHTTHTHVHTHCEVLLLYTVYTWDHKNTSLSVDTQAYSHTSVHTHIH